MANTIVQGPNYGPTNSQRLLQLLGSTPQRQAQERLANAVQMLLPQVSEGVSFPSAEEAVYNARPGPYAPPQFASSRKLFFPASTSGGDGGVKTWSEMAAEGTASPEVLKALEENRRATERAATGKKPSKGLFGGFKDYVKNLAGNAARLGIGALDIISRPGYVTNNMLKQRIKNIREADNPIELLGLDPGDIYQEVRHGLSGVTGTEKGTGAEVLEEAGVKNKAIRGVGGFALGVATDPLTWLSLGTGAALKAGGKQLAKELIESGIRDPTLHRLAKTSLTDLQRVVGTGAARGAKKLTTDEVKAAALNVLEYNTERLGKSDAAKTMFKNLVETGGKSEGEAAGLVDAWINEVNEDILGRIEKAASGLTKGKLEARLGFLGRGQNLLPQKVGERAYSVFTKPTEMIKKTGLGEGFMNHFVYEAKFPGKLGEMRNKVLSHSLREMEGFQHELRREFKGVTREQRKLISSAIEKKLDLSNVLVKGGNGKTLEDVKQYAIAKLREMGKNEVDLGKRGLDDLWGDDYLYHFYKGKGLRKGKEFYANVEKMRNLRKQGLKEIVPGMNDLEAAKNLGLNPEEDIFRVLLGRAGKMHRDLNNIVLRADAVLQYGKPFQRTMGNAPKLGYTEVSERYLTPELKDMIGKSGKWYMPTDMYKFFDTLNQLQSINNVNEVRGLWKVLDTGNRWFKFARTVPRPAYHFRNAMSDAVMGWLDGTTALDYARLARHRMQSLKGGLSPIKLHGGRSIEYREAQKLFQDTAQGGGFIHTEIPLGVAPADARGAVNSGLQALRKASEKREDFFREGHFLRSLKDEYNQLAKEKVPLTITPERHAAMLQEAAQRAARRVNRYNIDYNALTPFEQKWMKRLIPFYTYTKKATPVILNNMLTNPGRFMMIPKGRNAVQELLEEDGGFMSPLQVPDFMREANAFINLTGGQEPFLFDITSLPQYSLTNPLGVEGEPGPADYSALMSKFNPAITFLPEMAQGKKYFAGQKLEGPIDWLNQTINPFDWVARQKKAGPTGLLQNIGVRKVSEEQQVASIKKDTERAKATNALLNANLRNYGLEISTSTQKSGTVYKLLDRIQGRNLGTFKSPAQAQQAADKIIARRG